MRQADKLYNPTRRSLFYARWPKSRKRKIFYKFMSSQLEEEDQQKAFESLLEKKAQRQLSRQDVSWLVYLNLVLHGMIDEIDNYTKILAPGERSQDGNKSQVKFQ